MASPDVGSKKRSVLRNFLSQPARSAFNEGELHASFLMQTCARCNGLARTRRTITSHRARAVTCCQGAGNKPDFHGADRKRAFRQKMDGRAADRQLQGPDRQAGDQAAARHLLSCLAAAKACANTGIKHEAPRPPLQLSAVALEPRATVKLQPDVDIDLGQQRNLICAQPNAAPAALVKKAGGATACGCVQKPPRNRLRKSANPGILMQTNGRYRADRGPIHATCAPDCRPIRKAPAQPNATPPASDGARPNQFTTRVCRSGCAMRALPITRCSTDLSAFTRAICAFVSVPLLVSGGPPSTRFSVFGTGR